MNLVGFIIGNPVMNRLWAGIPGTRLPGVGPIQIAIQYVPRDLAPGYSGRGLKLNSHLYLALRLRINGAVPLPLPYAFMHSQGQLYFHLLCAFREDYL